MLAYCACAQRAGSQRDQLAGLALGGRQRLPAAWAVELLGDEIQRQEPLGGAREAGDAVSAPSGLARLCAEQG